MAGSPRQGRTATLPDNVIAGVIDFAQLHRPARAPFCDQNVAIGFDFDQMASCGRGWFRRERKLPWNVCHARRPPRLDVLEERYARGEIKWDEYLQKQRDSFAE